MSLQQNKKDWCLVYSLASALHYVGLVQEANDLAEIVEDTSDVDIKNAMQALVQNMREKVPTIGQHVSFGAFRNKKKKAKPLPTLKQLCTEKSIYPTLVIPQGKDCGVNHAVCIVDDLVFDSTQAFALRLNKKTLDWSVNHEEGCQGIHAMIRFERPSKKEGKSQKYG